MSLFGGDSWAREAQCRKRRVDDLLIEGVEASAYKKLSNGKLTCLLCPNNPDLDNPVMLSHNMKSEIGNLSMPRIDANSTEIENVANGFVGEVKSLDYRARLERELGFTASGWKRDGHGRWFKDENVEFDSDEENPNIVLNETTGFAR